MDLSSTALIQPDPNPMVLIPARGVRLVRRDGVAFTYANEPHYVTKAKADRIDDIITKQLRGLDKIDPNIYVPVGVLISIRLCNFGDAADPYDVLEAVNEAFIFTDNCRSIEVIS